MKNSERICPTCASNVHGRKRKVFCSVKCKNVHHHIAEKEVEEILYLKNQFLRRNKVILKGLCGADVKKAIVHRDILFKIGFNVNSFITAINRGGEIFYRIQEFEFRFLSHGLIEVTRRELKDKIFKEFLDRWALEFNEDVFLRIEGEFLKKYLKRTYLSPSERLTVMPFINQCSGLFSTRY